MEEQAKYTVLKKCPFCGKEPTVKEEYSLAGVKNYKIYCDDVSPYCCHPSTWFWNDFEDAAEQWNRRSE